MLREGERNEAELAGTLVDHFLTTIASVPIETKERLWDFLPFGMNDHASGSALIRCTGKSQAQSAPCCFLPILHRIYFIRGVKARIEISSLSRWQVFGAPCETY